MLKGAIFINIKKRLIISSIICSLLILASGCGDNQTTDNNTSKAEVLTEHNVVSFAKTEADIAKCAYTLEELYNASDFVAEVKITDTSSFIWPDTDMIYTNLTPEIINIYKGSFNNELLTVSGGYMNYKKYANSPEIIKEFGHALDTSEYSEKELETAEIYYDLYGNYIPEIGDKLIFFGIRDRNNETENYYVTYSNQGIFLCDNNGTISNQALLVDDNGFTEPLAKDLTKLFNNTEKHKQKNMLNETSTVLNIPKSEFINEINSME